MKNEVKFLIFFFFFYYFTYIILVVCVYMCMRVNKPRSTLNINRHKGTARNLENEHMSKVSEHIADDG